MSTRRKRRGLRGKAAANPATDLIWRSVVAVIGVSVTLVGVVFLVTPGPGWLVIFIGLGILATEFAWAERALLKAKMAALRARNQALDPARRRWLQAFAIALVVGLSAGVWMLVR